MSIPHVSEFVGPDLTNLHYRTGRAINCLIWQMQKLKAFLSVFYRCRNRGLERSLSSKIVQLEMADVESQ